MNSTSGRKLGLWVGLFVVMGGATYLLLVLLDFSLAKYISSSTPSSYAEAKSIMEDRVKDEDIPQKRRAIEEGYQPILYPYFVPVDEDIKQLALKYGVAPLAPQPDTDIYFCNEGYGLVKYKTDRFGFRNPDAIWDKKVKLTLIGDSFVQGACVSYHDSIQGLLSEKGVENISLGTGANSPYHYASLIQNFVPCIAPQYLGLVFYSNDNVIEENKFYFDHYLKNKTSPSYLTHDCRKLSDELTDFYSDVKKIMLSKAESIDNLALPGNKGILQRVGRYLSLPTIRTLLKRLGQSSYNLPHGAKLAIDRAVSLCRLHGCTPFVIYIPNSAYWNPDSRALEFAKALREYSDGRLRFEDVTETLKSHGDKVYALKGGHLSPFGYDLVAKEIKQLLHQ